jgi:hypothetical protein
MKFGKVFWESNLQITPPVYYAQSLGNVYSNHKLVWSYFKSYKRDFLFQSNINDKAKTGNIKIISSSPPTRAKTLNCKKIPKEFFENKFFKFQIKYAQSQYSDILKAQKQFLDEVERLNPSFCIVDDVSDPIKVEYFKSKFNKTVKYQYFNISGEIGIDYSSLCKLYDVGLGYNQSDGFGLMNLSPLEII